MRYCAKAIHFSITIMIIIIMSVMETVMAGNRGGGKYFSQRTTRLFIIMTGCVGRGGKGSQEFFASKNNQTPRPRFPAHFLGIRMS